MKIFIILIWLLWMPTGTEYIIINDILYKMPDSEIAKVKTAYNIEDTDVDRFEFNKGSCYASTVEWIKVDAITLGTKDAWNMFQVKTTPLFLYEGKFVNMEYFYPSDIESIGLYPIDQAVSKFGCKGLNPIFVITLKKGTTIQDKPVGGIILKAE